MIKKQKKKVLKKKGKLVKKGCKREIVRILLYFNY